MLIRFKYFRRKYYNEMLEYINSIQLNNECLPSHHGNYRHAFLCYFKSKHWYFEDVCWKNLKEVKQNDNSQQLFSHVRQHLNCRTNCFISNECRTNFVKECISLLDKK